MKEELKNLTPEQVEELKKLGVEFEDTQMVWSCFKPTMELLDEYPLSTRRKYKEENTIFIAAPNLQEVWERLPDKILIIDKYYYNLYLDKHTSPKITEHAASYTALLKNKKKEIDILHEEVSSDSSLMACFALLKWVATNYPESLIKNQ